MKCKDEEKYDDDDEMTCPGQDTGPLVNETDEVRNRWTMIGPVNLFYTISYFQKGDFLGRVIISEYSQIWLCVCHILNKFERNVFLIFPTNLGQDLLPLD